MSLAVRFRVYALVVLLALSALCANGCTFYGLDGKGPSSRNYYSEKLSSVEPTRLTNWKKSAHGPDSSTGDALRDGYTLHKYRTGTIIAPNFVGGYGIRKHLVPKDEKEDKRPLIEVEDVWGFSAPLYMTVERNVYGADSGKCIGYHDTTSFTLLILSHEAVWPRDEDEISDAHKSLENVAYIRYSSFSVGWGLLAAGTKNRQAYMQIAWIPIPLWTVD